MSINKKFYELQELILAKTSVEKCILHIEKRKERTIYTWIEKELEVFMRNFQKDIELGSKIDDLRIALNSKSYMQLLLILRSINEILDRRINEIYSSMKEKTS